MSLPTATEDARAGEGAVRVLGPHGAAAFCGMILSAPVVMSRPKTAGLDALLLLGAALGCLVPTAWVSFPAAVVLLLWLPGRLLVKARAEAGNGE